MAAISMTQQSSLEGEELVSFLLKPVSSFEKSLPRALEEAAKQQHLAYHIGQFLARHFITNPEFLSTFLNLAWTDHNEACHAAYQEVLLNLASVCPGSISLIMHSLIARLATDANAEGEPEDGRALKILINMIKVVPASSAFLMGIIEYHFPFHLRSVNEHVAFVRNLLSLAKQRSLWRYKILELIISKMLVLDTQIQSEINLVEEDGEEKEEEIPGDLRELETLEAAEARKERQYRRMTREHLQKLDIILEMLIRFCETFVLRELAPKDKAPSRDMFSFLLYVFERHIMSTLESRYTQFLHFYMVSLQPSLADQFLGLLFHPLLQLCQGIGQGQQMNINPTCLAAISYIGSFVARARFVSGDLLCLSFEMLADICTRLVAATTQTRISPLITMAHQNLLYIFLFRHAELQLRVGQDGLRKIFARLVDRPRVLRSCNRAIIEPFLQMACVQMGLFDPPPELTSAIGCANSQEDSIEEYFPFDPLPFKHSTHYIMPHLILLEK